MIIMNRIKWIVTIAAGALALPLSALAGSLTPETFTATIGVGETVHVEKTVTTDEGSAVSKVDVFFLADNTGSMGGLITNAKAVAGSLLSGLSASYADINFGVGRYLGDPGESGYNQTTAYTMMQGITSDATATQTAINGWFASGGGDGPEANFYALQQAATDGALTSGGLTSGQVTGWRTGAQKVIVWFGDAVSHTMSVTQAEVIAALTGENVIVAALNTRGAASGIDTSGQATAVAAATGGTVTNNVSSSDAAAVQADIEAAIAAATSTIDLMLTTIGDTSGLNITFTCTHIAGCDDVTGGESRTFDMAITGLTEGTYVFDTIAAGVAGAVEADRIIVGEGGTIPEPASIALMGLGLVAMGAARRRRA